MELAIREAEEVRRSWFLVRIRCGRRRGRPIPSDVLLYLFKKHIHQTPHFDHKERYSNRRKSNQSKVNEVEYENSSDDENGFEDEVGEDEGFDWEKEMKSEIGEES
ncbi:hypothetical protein Salat_1970300 [Sesamum alatum]|uniref:Uncharacterized protein n=1 Tax=Sesamum alatum TaxID=300844 RepID=A0AAE2CJ45_9LAMI|nr:hypothetical protein Salat_1970300 [Sesamum alatum]